MRANARPGRTGAPGQRAYGWSDVSIPALDHSNKSLINRRQGKFQLEVLPDVGHYLHEVSSGTHCLAGSADIDAGQSIVACPDPRDILAEEHTGPRSAAKDRLDSS